jgi:hypothetical protein
MEWNEKWNEMEKGIVIYFMSQCAHFIVFPTLAYMCNGICMEVLHEACVVYMIVYSDLAIVADNRKIVASLLPMSTINS